MGATASINSETPDVQLVNFTNREQFLKDCNQFYDTMQSCDGSAQKSRVYSVLNGLHQASEILNIFMLYCPGGRMSPPTFVNLCRDIKYLDKTFTSENALTVFEVGRKSYYEGSKELPNDGQVEVNYAGFLYHVVPELAFAKSIDEDVLVDRIARHHMPNPVVERKISFKRSLSSLKSPGVSPVNKAISNNTFKSIKESTVEEKKEENNSAELTDVTSSHMREVVQETNVDLDVNAVMKNQAATVIQSKFRCRLSKRVATNLKQLKKGKHIKDAAIAPKVKPQIEKALKKVFQFYCPNDDIDQEGFCALLDDGGLLCRKYLRLDAEFNFKETIAKVDLSDTPRKYTPGVRYKKRFTFLVFKDIALSFVALSTGKPYDAVVDLILKNNEE